MTPRQLLADALKSIERNRSLVIAFIVLVTAFEVAFTAVELPFVDQLHEGKAPPGLRAFDLAVQLAHAAIYSALLAVVFARFGKDIDRPLWKCQSDGEAVSKYFAPWFVISLLFLLIQQLLRLSQAQGNADLQALGLFLFMTLYVLAIPIGACIMYHGGFGGAPLSESLKPIGRQIGSVVVVFLVDLGGFLVLIILPAVIPRDLPLVLAVVAPIPLAFIDCLAFAAMWRICMVNRDSPEDNDYDLF
ncbi:MAG: hypothetical protein ACLFTT_12185 [Candidatus Hydrogenedentota bacterium]